ncbi:hypothetical protein CSUI_001608 [Cystoisospora suis]|uniref:Uncharacterized protein n=1 Tax=Cystoisospora suis TaxID=483139 RepID=A0A2C6L7Y0_9APIC|nr:hypothetical protein CSUI_001608 [Cystoisospora suis]
MRLGDERPTPGGSRCPFLLSPSLPSNALLLPLTAVSCSCASCCLGQCSTSPERGAWRCSFRRVPTCSLLPPLDSLRSFRILSSYRPPVHSCAVGCTCFGRRGVTCPCPGVVLG